MKTVDLNKAQHFVADNKPFGSRDFQDISRNLWRDNLNFNIFDGIGCYTEEAKQFFKDNDLKLEPGETPADAILNFAEWNELGYQCDKAPTKRSDVKFSGSMIMSQYMEAQDSGKRDFKQSKDSYYAPVSGDEMNYIDEITNESYK